MFRAASVGVTGFLSQQIQQTNNSLSLQLRRQHSERTASICGTLRLCHLMHAGLFARQSVWIRVQGMHLIVYWKVHRELLDMQHAPRELLYARSLKQTG